MKKYNLYYLLIFLSLGSLSKVDYSKCIEFLFPTPTVGGINTGMVPYLPFKLSPEGKITPHDDVLEHKYSKDEKQHTIRYELPIFKGATNQNLKSKNPFKQDFRKVSLVIQLNENEEIIEIFTDQNLSQKEIDILSKEQLAFYEANTPEELKKSQREWAKSSGQSFQPPFFAFSGSKVKFEIKNGQCIPIQSTNIGLTEPKENGKTFEARNFDTRLCKEIDEFLSEYPEAASCFKRNLNKKMSLIFSKYLRRDQVYGGVMGGGTPNFFGIPSLNQRLMYGQQYAYDDKTIEENQKRSASSPVITGHMILQNCYDQGLHSFIKDTSIWEETGVETGAASAPIGGGKPK